MHVVAQMKTSRMLGSKGNGLFLVSGRNFGDDDDSAFLIRAGDVFEAREIFAEEIDAEAPSDDNDTPYFIVQCDLVGVIMEQQL